MKLSLNWVRDFITLDENLQNKELIETITLSVCEVEGFEETGRHLKDIITAQVLSIKPHPNAEKLTLVTIDLGHRQLEIVCGASNFKPSDKVAYAGLGVCLPDGTKIKKAKIRGIESEGMLLAEDELGFSEDHEGVMILPPKANLGETLDQIYPDQVDVIMEIDNKSITHRPDLWGHYGFAREFGTIYKTPIKSLPSKPEDIRGEGKALIDVEVICKDYVPRFSGLSIENLEARPSPDWIRYRLNRVGLRPINNLVDITNYVMLELGQPMHAFDAAQIKGQKLIVRLAKNGDRVMTLHKKEVDLTDEDMTICDTNGASVVAGVVGGVNSGVTENSTAIFLEAANWNPVLIRKTSTRIGLRTDASQRYEKGLDPELTVFAIARATDLLRLSNPELKIRGGLVDIFGKKIDPVTVETSLNFIRERLGKNIASNEILGILERLGFRITRKEPKLVVEVPTYRRTGDVSIPEDLVEEIGRIHGFNHIAPLAPQFPIERPIFNQQRLFERKIRNGLAQSGFHEVLSYPLSSSKLEERFDLDQSQMLRIINPVSDHQEQMRTSMLPHFADCVYKNQKIAFDFSVFEIGRIYQRSKMGENSEPHRLILAVSKTKQNLGDSFYELKSKMSYLFSKLMLPSIRWESINDERRKPYQHQNISSAILCGEIEVGEIYDFTPRFMKKLELKEDVCLAELDLEKLFAVNKREYHHLGVSKYPAVIFELSLIVDGKVYYQEIEDLVLGVDKTISKVSFLDVFYPKDLPGKKSISIQVDFRSWEKTLNSEEVKTLQEKLVASLEKRGYYLREN